MEGGLRLTSVRDETATMVGGALTLHPEGRFAFGGEGWILLNEREIPGEVADSDLKLRMAYGGGTVRAVLYQGGWSTMEAGLLLGAGTARVSLAVVGTEIAADNFGVVEPHVALSLTPGGPVYLRLLGGYRGAFGVEDLPGISPEHMRGWTLGLALGIGPL